METQSIDVDSFISLFLIDSEDLEDNEALISDEKCAERLQLQEAIMASLIALQSFPNPKGPREVGEPSTKGSKEAGESSQSPCEICAEYKTSSPNPKVTGEVGEPSVKGSKEVGESSQSLCEICAENKNRGDMVAVQNCSHRFCTECVAKHISINIKKTIIRNHETARVLMCPGLDCEGILEIEKCREIVPKDVVSMWDDVICEAMIAPCEKFYCPYKNCSALLVNDSEEGVIREAECPFCRRLMCVKCNVPWHAGVDCEDFSKLSENEKGREDLMVHLLAKENMWQRCPQCKFFVEKKEGCLHMTCRCGFQFCYKCGAAWSSTHGCL